MDKLEEFIRENRSQLDKHEPSVKAWKISQQECGSGEPAYS